MRVHSAEVAGHLPPPHLPPGGSARDAWSAVRCGRGGGPPASAPACEEGERARVSSHKHKEPTTQPSKSNQGTTLPRAPTWRLLLKALQRRLRHGRIDVRLAAARGLAGCRRRAARRAPRLRRAAVHLALLTGPRAPALAAAARHTAVPAARAGACRGAVAAALLLRAAPLLAELARDGQGRPHEGAVRSNAQQRWLANLTPPPQPPT